MPFTPVDKKEVSKTSATPPTSGGGTFTPVTPTGLPNINQPTTATLPPGGNPILREVAKPFTIPERAGRAATVGMVHAGAATGIDPANAMTMNPSALDVPTLIAAVQNMQGTIEKLKSALGRAGAAYQPGFQPQPGEEGPAAAGEILGNTVAMAPLAEAAPAGAAAEAAINAAAAGGLTAAHQATEQGSIDPMTVGENAAMGAVPPLLSPAFDAFSATAKKLLPEILQKTQNSPAKGTQILMDNPDVGKLYTGTIDELKQKFAAVGSKLKELKTAAGSVLGKVKEDLGIKIPTEDAGDEAAQIANKLAMGPGKAATNDVADYFSGNITDKSPQDTQQALYRMGKYTPQEIGSAYKIADKIPESQRVKYLYGLRKAIDNNVDFAERGTALAPSGEGTINSSEAVELKKLRNQINTKIDTLPGGSDLRAADDKYHEIAGLYDQLQAKVQTPGTAEDTLSKIFRGDLNGITHGRSKDVEEALNKLDDIAGEPVTRDVWNSLTVNHFNKYVGRGLGTFMVGQGAGMAAALSHNPLAVLPAIPFVSPKVAGAMIKLGVKAGPYVGDFLSQISNPKLQSAIIASIVAANKGEK